MSSERYTRRRITKGKNVMYPTIVCHPVSNVTSIFHQKKKKKKKKNVQNFKQIHNRFDGYRFAIGDKIFITILFFSFLRFHIRCGSAEKIFIIFYYILLLLLFLQTVEIFVSNYNFNFFKNTLFTPASFSISTCKLFNQTPGSFYPRFSKKREFIRNRIDNAPTPRSS